MYSMNKYIEQMRDAVQRYFRLAQAAQEKINKNNSIYRTDIADEENAKVLTDLRLKRGEAVDAISAAQQAGRSEAMSGKELKGSEITSDAKLLELDLLTGEQFDDLVERYKKNSTMSILLKQYGDKKNAEAQKAGEVISFRFDTTKIITPERKAEVFDRFAMSALDLIDRLGQERTFAAGLDSPMLRASIENFGEPNDFNKSLLEIL